jgi:hypothetical protein
VLVAEYDGIADLASMNQAGAEIASLIRAHGDLNLHIIMDFSQVERFGFSVKDVQRNQQHLIPYGWVVVITSSKMMQLLSNIYSHMTGAHLRLADSQAEAIAFLKKHDPTL